ncbi:DHH family phosphoesterase [Candidatus Pacearchaeota archaeon]|nr:DHH family phosphoesterase [Candidatus Pacearchaeota archaeon]
MLTPKQIEEIKEHLERAQNPLFFYDNDADGLCSYLLLRRYIGRGKGVAVKSYPDLNLQYAKKAQELKADAVFVLDKPLIAKEFMEEIDKMQLPLIWIDHHYSEDNGIEKRFGKNYSNLHIYNPTYNKGKDISNEPVTFLVYKITERKEDLWLAVIGCIADNFMPSFISEFDKQWPDFLTRNDKIRGPFDIYYGTEIGRIARAFSFGLKDSITHVVQMQNFLISCKSPSDVFMEIEGNKSFREKYNEIKKKYNTLLDMAKECKKENLIFFDYSGELSISADLANELSYLYSNFFIVVAYKKGMISNISLRGNKVRDILERVLKQFPDATGGGHENAVGARIKTEDLQKFREVLEGEITRK